MAPPTDGSKATAIVGRFVKGPDLLQQLRRIGQVHIRANCWSCMRKAKREAA